MTSNSTIAIILGHSISKGNHSMLQIAQAGDEDLLIMFSDGWDF